MTYKNFMCIVIYTIIIMYIIMKNHVCRVHGYNTAIKATIILQLYMHTCYVKLTAHKIAIKSHNDLCLFSILYNYISCCGLL